MSRLSGRWGSHPRGNRASRRVGPVNWAAVIIGIAALIAAATVSRSLLASPPPAAPVPPVHLTPVRYLGLYEPHVLHSYAPVNRFAQAIGRQPNIVSYYSAWLEPFHATFATIAARHGAVPLVQINPVGISLTAIASGAYDGYLSNYAAAVTSYGRPVILSFGHEMNGRWYSWGYRHAPAAAFVAAWRHIVTLFRRLGAGNVTWLWTINVINKRNNSIPNPAPWWPGSSYVSWVGIDGYYHRATWKFAPLFGPTIAAVRELTGAPILIAETGAAADAGQPGNIADLFAGIRAFGLLGFLWFDSVGNRDWRLSSPAALAAFRQGARA